MQTCDFQIPLGRSLFKCFGAAGQTHYILRQYLRPGIFNLLLTLVDQLLQALLLCLQLYQLLTQLLLALLTFR
ncbi:hypothetical protein SAMN05216214_10895 [Atopomonas hussainii]|uniref:Uncharacterized protein n=1 Tax=Atopomonas hussainii TaxID=1429083 RepID=A0A1H7MJU3_9GAMM|nr:hypothetical protein SAMN05216214_10895 [Atopomonas hussainii]